MPYDYSLCRNNFNLFKGAQMKKPLLPMPLIHLLIFSHLSAHNINTLVFH
jgi:hypothetical protein